MTAQRPCVLVFAGHDPSGGAGIQADIEAIAAQGAHALTVITSLTVQDNNQVHAVHPVAPDIVSAQAQNLIKHFTVNVVKLGIVGSLENALVIASLISELRSKNPDLSVVLDPVLSSGHGHKLALDDAVLAIAPLLEVATLITPNLPEAMRLAPHGLTAAQQATSLFGGACRDVLLKGGHGQEQQVCNRWFSQRAQFFELTWNWPRLSFEFHGSGCTLAAAIAGQLACGHSMEKSLHAAQSYTQLSLERAYPIAVGQLIPQRHFVAPKINSLESDDRETIR
ncbi:bifunctional hydroxymethylpyrimidine kinase/phosphomethylpyrimidine kinase [Undibacterium sp. Di24W]|uniref:bifunctional hydroxymethylpyrimidine kinase/phosphomethylpyrimidine kinase n=1 Tax=Undibacterium sp. Di24W TaxID=3413033 RepID=UPI003BEF7CD5